MLPRVLFREMFGLDVRALALFRIALGLLLAADLLTRSLLLEEHYTASGVWPLADLGFESPGPRPFFPDFLYPHLWRDTFPWQAGLFLLHAVVAAGICLGFRTRICMGIAWFLLVSLHGRNPAVIYGADDLLRMMLFWSMFLPWHRLEARSSSAHVHCSFAGAALLLQVFFMYVFTWLCKNGEDWFRGDAVYYAVHLDIYAQSAARYMRDFPDLLRPLSLSVFWFELLGPVLLFAPLGTYRLRLIGMVGLLLMQIGFGLFLSLGLFPWIAAAALLPFLRLPGFKANDSADVPTKPPASESSRGTWASRALVLFQVICMVHILLLNMGLARRVLPAGVYDFLTFGVRLDQTWCMFAPQPGRTNAWDRFVIESSRGERREIFPGSQVSGPALLDLYDRAGGRRRDYFTELNDEKHQKLYARYLCRRHKHAFSHGIAFVEIHQVAEDIPAPEYGSYGRRRKQHPVRREEILLRLQCTPGAFRVNSGSRKE